MDHRRKIEFSVNGTIFSGCIRSQVGVKIGFAVIFSNHMVVTNKNNYAFDIAVDGRVHVYQSLLNFGFFIEWNKCNFIDLPL